MTVADGVESLQSGWLESWLSGRTPWPPDPTNKAYVDQFFATATEDRKRQQRTWMPPEMQEIGTLRDAVAGAIDGPSELNEVDDPKLMADYLRNTLGRVDAYVKLLADRLEKNGYGG